MFSDVIIKWTAVQLATDSNNILHYFIPTLSAQPLVEEVPR